ncbi:hypothetical protein QIT00_35110, partial [Streptomyces sp. B-S-A12]|nr:hypothetical protein [Streptomyces sp. B-S-A12]
MVRSPHEALHQIFQEIPDVFSRTFRTLGLPFPDPVEVSLMPTDLTETRPLERRVDTLLHMRTRDEGSYLLAVESQGRKDKAKLASWAYYTAHLHSKYGLPLVLLVTCQDKATVEWASGPFAIGTRQWRTMTLSPLVLGPHKVPLVTDPGAAARDIPLATLSAITHGKDADAAGIVNYPSL